MNSINGGPNTSIVAFLDVIACGFGAIVLLVLILPVGENSGRGGLAPISKYDEAQSRSIALSQGVTDKNLEIASLQAVIEELQKQPSNQAAQSDGASILQELELELAATKQQISRKTKVLKAQITQRGIEEKKPPKQLYGIPVDSDYLALVVDTSGSMKRIWPRVTAVVRDILVNYPDLRGFQILSDQGEFLLVQNNNWLRNDEQQVKSVLKKFRNWNVYSNSSPVEGVKVAVADLLAPNINMAVIVIGDDYSGTDFDGFLRQIDRITSGVGVSAQLRIHSIGFYNDLYSQHPERFTRLMQVLTFNHGGAFLYIGDEVSGRVTVGRGLRTPIAD